MNERITHYCKICGKGYNHCEKCLVVQNYRSLTDTEYHFKIYMVLEDLRNEDINEEQARQRFAKLNITPETDLSDLIPAVAEAIYKIVKKPVSYPNKRNNNK